MNGLEAVMSNEKEQKHSLAKTQRPVSVVFCRQGAENSTDMGKEQIG